MAGTGHGRNRTREKGAGWPSVGYGLHRLVSMTRAALAPPDSHTMSRRARIYIAAGGFRHTGTGLTMLLAPWLYSSAIFVPIFNVFGYRSVVTWGWTMVVVGLVCYVGALSRNPRIARAGIGGSAVVTSILALGLTLGLINSWMGFSSHLTGEELYTLIRSHPGTFPVALLDKVAPPPSPLLMIAFISFGIKDFSMCAQPLRVPLEDRRLRAVPR